MWGLPHVDTSRRRRGLFIVMRMSRAIHHAPTKVRLAVWLILQAMLMVGCAANSTHAQDEESEFAVIVADQQAMIESPELFTQRWIDFNEHVRECMREQGFAFTPAPAPSAQSWAKAQRLPGYYVLSMSVPDAQENGLGLFLDYPEPGEERPWPFSAPELDGNPDVVSSEEFAWDVAMMGFGDDPHASSTVDSGCYPDALHHVGPLSFAESGPLIDQEAELQRFARMLSDPRAAEFLASWRTCMIERAYPEGLDPFNQESQFHLLYSEIIPAQLDLRIDPLAGERVPDEHREAVIAIERQFAIDYVECALPGRAALAELWSEHLGYLP